MELSNVIQYSALLDHAQKLGYTKDMADTLFHKYNNGIHTIYEFDIHENDDVTKILKSFFKKIKVSEFTIKA